MAACGALLIRGPKRIDLFRKPLELVNPADESVEAPESRLSMVVLSKSHHVIKRLPRSGSAIVLAGHYCLAPDLQTFSHEGVEEASSFRLGATIAAAMLAQNRYCKLVLCVDDIGVPPEERNKIKSTYALPCNYRSILDQERLSADSLTVCFASTLRNSASALLRKLYRGSPEHVIRDSSTRDGLVRCSDGGNCSVDTGGGVACKVASCSGENPAAEDERKFMCNIVLATLFDDLRARFHPDFQVNIFNEQYSSRLNMGRQVARTLLVNDTPMINLFCKDGRYFTHDLPVSPAHVAQGSCGDSNSGRRPLNL